MESESIVKVSINSSEEYTQIEISGHSMQQFILFDSYKLIEFGNEVSLIIDSYSYNGIYISLEDAAIKYLINKIGDPIEDKIYYGLFGTLEK